MVRLMLSLSACPSIDTWDLHPNADKPHSQLEGVALLLLLGCHQLAKSNGLKTAFD